MKQPCYCLAMGGPRWLRHSLLISLVVAFLTQALYFSRTLVFSDDEQGYLVFGYLAARGTVSLFQDDVLGARTPLPFYILGWSQLVVGRDLWTARLLSIVFAAGSLWLTIRIARMLGGPTSGLLAGLLLATQGATVGYFTTAGYHAISAFIVLAVLHVFIGPPLPGRYLLAAAATGLLFLTRTHISPLIPLLLAVCIIRSPNWRTRLLAGALGLATPAIFFLSDPTHLKLLAYAGPFQHLAARWGYRSVFYFYDYSSPPLAEQLRSLLLFARRYESLTLTAGGLAIASIWHSARTILLTTWHARPEIRFLMIVFAYGVACLLLIVAPYNLKVAVAYFPAYAPLAAILLGTGVTQLLLSPQTPAAARLIVVLTVCLASVVSVAYPHQPLLPTPPGRPFRDDAIVRLQNLANGLERILEPGSHVFLVGDSLPLYLANRLPYLRQVMHPTTLAGHSEDPLLVARSGVWGRDQIEDWLSRDATYAVIVPRWLEALRPNRTRNIARIEELLALHFSLVAVLDDYFGLSYHVYRRIPR